MVNKSLAAVYEGEGIIRLRERPPELQKDQELFISIVPLPSERAAEEMQPSPLAYFHQLVEQLRRYEERYGMTSHEFYRRFQNGDIQEGPLDYFDWRTLYDGYRHMQERFGFSREQLADA